MDHSINLIPNVAELQPRTGQFRIREDAVVCYCGPGAGEVADLLAEYLRPATGFDLPTLESECSPGCISLSASEVSEAAPFGDESYSIVVTEESVRIEAAQASGLARAIQTLRQLLPSEIFASERQEENWLIPCLEIRDRPRFAWRGMHLDVSRHFFTVEEVCRFIDLIALHRYNILHLHLTDDQGWRIQIKAYPLLTDVGSCRECTLIGSESARPRRYDDIPHEGYYTQEDITRTVDFAGLRHITVVPEIDMPGHMQAAIAAYPELGNTSMKLKPLCHWGICQHILNTEPGTIEFMKTVLGEVMDLFPSPFIHVGGDEAAKYEWQESRALQEHMAELGLTGEDQMQSWFLRQMADFIVSRGRRMIGWEEIAEGGLAPGAAVMSWLGEDGGINAAKLGHDAVMAPHQFLYFDFHQSDPIREEPVANGFTITTGRVYAYDPISPKIPEDKRHHILGGQGQLWTEYIPNVEHLDYMAFPRTCALAEVLWLQPEQKSFRDFLRRLSTHRTRLAVLGCNAHPLP